MNATFNKQNISSIDTGPDVLRSIPARQVMRDQLAEDVERALRNGLKITHGPSPTFVPRKEAPRKPHPEKLVRQSSRLRTPSFAGSRSVPAGMISIGQAAMLCGLSHTNNAHLGHLRRAIELGWLTADHTLTKGDKSLYYFWPETPKAFFAKVGNVWWRSPEFKRLEKKA